MGEDVERRRCGDGGCVPRHGVSLITKGEKSDISGRLKKKCGPLLEYDHGVLELGSPTLLINKVSTQNIAGT